MKARSPWATSKLNLCFGEDLPVLLRHHRHRRSHGVTKPWRHVMNGPDNKPLGGLWASTALLPAGKWRPIPRRSAWSDWCASEAPHLINGRYQTQLFPQTDAMFAVIDSAADARALYDAFPDGDHPTAAFMRELAREHGGHTSGMFDLMIDWRAVMGRPIAGVWLTQRGERETHLPDDMHTTPTLNTWDAASVWFSRPAYRIGKTWPCPRIDPDPHGLGWDLEGAYADPDAVRERMRALLAEARGEGPETDAEEPGQA